MFFVSFSVYVKNSTLSHSPPMSIRPKESCYFTFCQYHSPVVSFFRPIPLLSIVWMKWVLFPTASI